MGESETKAITIKQTRQFASTLGLQKKWLSTHTQKQTDFMVERKQHQRQNSTTTGKHR